jgi:hypothetical protein
MLYNLSQKTRTKRNLSIHNSYYLIVSFTTLIPVRHIIQNCYINTNRLTATPRTFETPSSVRATPTSGVTPVSGATPASGATPQTHNPPPPTNLSTPSSTVNPSSNPSAPVSNTAPYPTLDKFLARNTSEDNASYHRFACIMVRVECTCAASGVAFVQGNLLIAFQFAYHFV